MPYCPKCDMDFVEGVTVCSDCHGPLYESREAAAKALKEEAERKQQENGEEYPDFPEALAAKQETPVRPPASYVKKSQKYEDRKSSASAFFLIGGAMTVFSVLCWLKVIDMPMTGASKLLIQGTFTVMGVGCLVIAFNTLRSAKALAAGIEEEEKETQEIIDWFAGTYQKEDLERQLDSEFGDMTEDEKNLKRFELIQDLLITSKDLPDQAYVEALCEDIFERLYEKTE